MRDTFVVAHHGNRLASIFFEPDYLSLDHPANRRARETRAPTGESLPISCRSNRTFDAG